MLAVIGPIGNKPKETPCMPCIMQGAFVMLCGWNHRKQLDPPEPRHHPTSLRSATFPKGEGISRQKKKHPACHVHAGCFCYALRVEL